MRNGQRDSCCNDPEREDDSKNAPKHNMAGRLCACRSRSFSDGTGGIRFLFRLKCACGRGCGKSKCLLDTAQDAERAEKGRGRETVQLVTLFLLDFLRLLPHFPEGVVFAALDGAERNFQHFGNFFLFVALAVEENAVALLII